MMQEQAIITLARRILGNKGISLSNMDGLNNVHAIGVGNGKHAIVKLVGPTSQEDDASIRTRAEALATSLEQEMAGQ